MTSNGTYPPEEKALNAALAKAQGEFPRIPKDKTAKTGAYSYTYASLDVILAAVRPVLAKHGLSIIQRLESPGGGGPAIRTELRHAEGGVIAASFPLGDRPQNPQQLGSLLTYLRRYTIQAMLGIAPEDDDDGQAASNAPRKPPAANRAPAVPKIPEGHPKADPKPAMAEPVNPAQTVVSFGKYEGQTIGEIAAHDRGYVGWLGQKSADEEIKAAAVLFLRDDDIPF